MDCKLYDPSGQAVGVLEEGEYGYCYSQRDIIGRDSVYDGCPTNEGLTAEPIDVRFAQETEAYRVEVTYSLERVDWMHSLQEGTYYNPKRTILKVFDPNGALVYHEVLGSKSGPGSFTVIPSDVEGAEVLLVADDSTVFAYTLPANAP